MLACHRGIAYKKHTWLVTGAALAEAYHLMKKVRNACAHGTKPPHQQLLKNPQRLAKSLEQALNRLNTP